MSSDTAYVQEHFPDAAKQAHAARLGMWVFLSSETLLFSGLFALYTMGRVVFPEGFKEGVGHNTKWLGTLNTFILLVSSFFVARSVHVLREGHRRRAQLLMGLTIALGLVFMAVKGFEYYEHVRHGAMPGGGTPFFVEHPTPGLPLFFGAYFALTGLHLVHVVIGVVFIAILAVRAGRTAAPAIEAHRAHMGAMYWHLVDAVWVFLWPMFYLTGSVGG